MTERSIQSSGSTREVMENMLKFLSSSFSAIENRTTEDKTCDSTSCFYCGGQLINWIKGDNPYMEHARWFPRCTFIRQVKGDNFVDLVQEKDENEEQINYKQVMEILNDCPLKYDILGTGNYQEAAVVYGKESEITRIDGNEIQVASVDGNKSQVERVDVSESIAGSIDGNEVKCTRTDTNQIEVDGKETEGARIYRNESEAVAVNETESTDRDDTREIIHGDIDENELEKSGFTETESEIAGDERNQSGMLRNDELRADVSDTDRYRRETDRYKFNIRSGLNRSWSSRLAAAGFYFTGPGDRVVCFSCGQSYDHWRRGDNPMQIHRQISPCCRFVLGEEENKPITDYDCILLELHERRKCTVCDDKKVTIVFLPCQHVCCCKECASRQQSCPRCGETIRSARWVVLF